MMQPFAVIRADASKSIGGGHIMRCMALGFELSKAGWIYAFASRPETADTVPLLSASDSELFLLRGKRKEEQFEIRNRWPGGCDLLIVDHYHRDASFETKCRGWARRILVVDDLADRDHDCDILIDQTPGRRETDYAGIVSPGCRLLLGPRFALLRSAFKQARFAALRRREKIGPVETILISFGMIDNRNGCLASLMALKRAGYQGKAHVMIGSAAPHLDELRRSISAWPFKVCLHVDEKLPEDLMVQADLAIGAGGSMTWERCCLGLPSMVWVAAKNQQKVAEAMATTGALSLIQGNIQSQISEMAAIITNLISDHALRAEMSRKAAKTCDGYGALRCILAICPDEKTANGLKIRIRPGLQSDIDLIFDWQSDPSTRFFFRNPSSPTRDEHIHWMEQVLSSSDRHLFIIECNDSAVGVLRLDKYADPGNYEVSIIICKSYRGHGIGKAALRFAKNAFVGWSFRAEVHPENIASRNLFLSASYQEEQKNIFLSTSLIQSMYGTEMSKNSDKILCKTIR
jgi:UDP-2,4-diacetamido-2,4,6-trideoxy-beta-L-altropyranose hydrolase